MKKQVSLVVFACITAIGFSSVTAYAKVDFENNTGYEYQSTHEKLQNAKAHFVKKRYDLAFLDLIPLAKEGNADAQYGVGYLYFYGKGTTTDKKQGIDWIKKSAAQGFENAQKALEMLNIPMTEASVAKAETDTKNQDKITLTSKAKKSLDTEYNNEPNTQTYALLDDEEDDDLYNDVKGSVVGGGLTSNLPNNKIDYKNSHGEKPARDLIASSTATEQSIDNQLSELETRNDTSYLDEQLIQQAGNVKTYGPTLDTDTLWSIAKKVRPSKSISIQQMMLALLENNPNAFNRHNVNALKKNVILKIPNISKIKTLTGYDKLSETNDQDSDWLNS